MKKLIVSLVLNFLMMGISNASIIPMESLLIINTAEVEVSLENLTQKEIFQVAKYTAETNSLDFVVADEIKYIQIFTVNGTLKYQLPVMSNKLRISKKLFNKGEYRLGFIMEGNKSIEFTGVKVN